jgi:hypothetical protein
MVVFVGFGIIELFTAVFAQFACVKTRFLAGTVLPQMIHATVHLVAGAFAIFLLHTDTGLGYVILDKDNGIHEASGALNVEEVSALADFQFGEEEEIESDFG